MYNSMGIHSCDDIVRRMMTQNVKCGLSISLKITIDDFDRISGGFLNI